MRIATITVAVSKMMRTTNTTIRTGDRFEFSRFLVTRQAHPASATPDGRQWFLLGS